MPDVVLHLLLTGVVAVAAIWWKLATRSRDSIEPPPMNLRRLEEIAAVSDEEIIAAAEWWGEHPDADEPRILAALGPSAWTPVRRKPTVEVMTAAPLPPPKPSTGAPTTARGHVPMAVLAPGVIHIPAGMPHDLARRIANSPRAMVIPHGMELKPLPVRRPGRYDNCQHEDAEREEIRMLQSAAPVRTFVVACDKCDLAALRVQLRQKADQINALLEDLPLDTAWMTFKLTEDLRRRYDRLVADASRIKQQIQDLEPRTWPGRMF